MIKLDNNFTGMSPRNKALKSRRGIVKGVHSIDDLVQAHILLLQELVKLLEVQSRANTDSSTIDSQKNPFQVALRGVRNLLDFGSLV